MKIKRKIVSCFVTIILIMNTNIMAYAMDNNEPVEGSTSKVVLSDNNLSVAGNEQNYVKGYDADNGDSIFEQYVDGKLVRKYISCKRQEKIDIIDINEEETETIHFSLDEGIDKSMARASSSRRLGKIRYKYVSGVDAGICGAYVDYVKNTGLKQYDINGKYKDAASLAATLATIFGLPASCAVSLAGTVLSAFGIASTVATIVIPSCYLQSSYEEITYKLTDINNSSHQNSFFGTKYTIVESGKHINEIYTDGTYYPTSSWGATDFGSTVYNYLFNYSAWSIYAWN